MFNQLHGKELSYNNLLDIDAAVNLISEFEDTTFTILKHNNACGVASRDSLIESWKDALGADPVSAFGGVLITNKELDFETAEEINKIFFEVIIAPSYHKEIFFFFKILKSKKNRVILIQKDIKLSRTQFRTILNGVLYQDKDLKTDNHSDMKIVTELSPNEREFSDLEFISKVCKHTKSNTIVFKKQTTFI